MSKGEEIFGLHLRANRLEGWEREYRFSPPRRWRMDWANPSRLIAVEIEGGIWSGGRHTRASGFQNDAEKYNAATIQGWRVLRYSTQQVAQGNAIRDVLFLIESEAKKWKSEPSASS